MAFDLGCFIWLRFLCGASAMSVTGEKEIIKMWSDKLKKDAWWVVDGGNYTGPFNKWCDAKRLIADDAVKPFDITKHEFSEGLSISNMCESKVEIEFKDNDDFNYVPLNKSDVIAIAKALGVTGEDLK